ncbi:MAG: acyl-CoA thioesterase [Acinetobacter sp.]|nr:acyl-CoA thioesterase [Acinetobacter sp.]
MMELIDYPVIYNQNVAWGDMDAFGHVNNTVYYRYIESARICYFDQLNIFEQDVYTVVASSQCKYLSPVVYPDQLKIGVRKLTKITKHAKRHFWLNDVCTCHGLLPSHSA